MGLAADPSLLVGCHLPQPWVVPPSSVPQAPFPRLVFAGDVLFQMAEVHRQIQNQLEEMVSAPAWVCWALRLATGSAGVAAEQNGFPHFDRVTPAPLKWIC